MEELSCGGGKRSNLDMVGVGGIGSTCVRRTHVSLMTIITRLFLFATSYGDAERAYVSGSLIVGAFLVLHS